MAEDTKKGWSILMEVSALLHEEEDSKGDLKNTGEARALQYMKNRLQTEISKDATAFLKAKGFDGGGNKKKPPKPGQRRRRR